MDAGSFDIRVAHSVEDIGQEAWDYLGASCPFASYRWYRFGEAVLKSDMPVYIVLSQGTEPVARGTFWLKRHEPLPIPSRVVRWLVGRLLHYRPLLVCRVPMASASGLILPEPPLRDAALETIIWVAQELARQNGASFLLYDYLEYYAVEWRAWSDCFVQAALPDPGTCLKIVWPNFEGYVGHLSKSVRKDYRRHSNRASDLGVVVKPHQEVGAIDEAMALIRNVEQHHNAPPNPWARAVLQNASMVDITWLTAKIENRLVGCGLLLGDRETRFLGLLGLDYEVRYAYFQLLYEAIRSAIEQGIQILRGGGGAYELKQRLGFTLEDDNYVVLTGIGPLLQRLGRWLAVSGV